MKESNPLPNDYLDCTGRDDVLSDAVQNGRHLHCPNGSHLAMYDDQRVFFEGLINFIHDVDAGLI